MTRPLEVSSLAPHCCGSPKLPTVDHRNSPDELTVWRACSELRRPCSGCHLLVSSSICGSWSSNCPPSRLGPGAVAAHAIAVAVDVDNDASVQQAVQHGAGDHWVVVEHLAPARDPEIGRERDAAF